MKRFSEMFRRGPEKKKELVAGFNADAELESVLDEYVRARQRAMQLRLDGVDTPEGNAEFQAAVQKYGAIEELDGERLRIYLQPYLQLGNIDASRVPRGEYNRWYTAGALKAKK